MSSPQQPHYCWTEAELFRPHQQQKKHHQHHQQLAPNESHKSITIVQIYHQQHQHSPVCSCGYEQGSNGSIGTGSSSTCAATSTSRSGEEDPMQLKNVGAQSCCSFSSSSSAAAAGAAAGASSAIRQARRPALVPCTPSFTHADAQRLVGERMERPLLPGPDLMLAHIYDKE